MALLTTVKLKSREPALLHFCWWMTSLIQVLPVAWQMSTFWVRPLLGTHRVYLVVSFVPRQQFKLPLSQDAGILKSTGQVFFRRSLSERLMGLALWLHKRAQRGVCYSQSHFGMSSFWWQSPCMPHGQVASLISIPWPPIWFPFGGVAHEAPLLAIPGGCGRGSFSSML